MATLNRDPVNAPAYLDTDSDGQMNVMVRRDLWALNTFGYHGRPRHEDATHVALPWGCDKDELPSIIRCIKCFHNLDEERQGRHKK